MLEDEVQLLLYSEMHESNCVNGKTLIESTLKMPSVKYINYKSCSFISNHNSVSREIHLYATNFPKGLEETQCCL